MHAETRRTENLFGKLHMPSGIQITLQSRLDDKNYTHPCNLIFRFNFHPFLEPPSSTHPFHSRIPSLLKPYPVKQSAVIQLSLRLLPTPIPNPTPRKPIKIATRQPVPIRPMHHPRQITIISLIARRIRQEEIAVGRAELLACRRPRGAMLAAQIADFAGLRRCDGAGGLLAAAVGVEMGACSVAVSVVGDARGVDVVV